MSHIYTSMEQLIGCTPLLELGRLEQEYALSGRLLAKLESFNPAGSVKDRAAKSMLDDAEASGRLRPGGVVIEPTSGNTGIGLAAVAAVRGYRVIIVMPETMSEERRRLIRAYGAELVLTDGAKGVAGAIEQADVLAAEIPGSIVAGQFENPANPTAHYTTTGPELWADTDGKIDVFVAGAGTGGTITGVGRFLKEKKPSIRVIAVEPETSPVLSGGAPGPNQIQGLGAGFVPAVLDTSVYDEVVSVGIEESYETGRMLAQKEGILAGISSGAALFAAIEIAKRSEYEGKTIVTLLPDTGERYLSTPMFEM